MKKWIKKNWVYVVFAATVAVMIGMFIYSGGCAKQVEPNIVTTPITQAQNALIKMVDQNWIVTCGIVLVVVGVMILLNGNTKGLAVIGGGLAAIALAGLAATYFSILADYRGWVLAVFIIGILAGIFYFLRTAADFDGDGNVDWDDIKYLFKHIGKPVTPNEVPIKGV
jgi:hypothetical protein